MRVLPPIVLSFVWFTLCAPPSNAQGIRVLSDRLGTGFGLQVPDAIRRAKTEDARDGDWAWTLVGAAAAAYDTNTTQAPDGDEIAFFPPVTGG